MKNGVVKHCYGFFAAECLFEQCPKSCRDCWYNTGQCDDCIFESSEQCVYPNKDKKIVIKEERIQT